MASSRHLFCLAIHACNGLIVSIQHTVLYRMKKTVLQIQDCQASKQASHKKKCNNSWDQSLLASFQTWFIAIAFLHVHNRPIDQLTNRPNHAYHPYHAYIRLKLYIIPQQASKQARQFFERCFYCSVLFARF